MNSKIKIKFKKWIIHVLLRKSKVLSKSRNSFQSFTEGKKRGRERRREGTKRKEALRWPLLPQGSPSSPSPTDLQRGWMENFFFRPAHLVSQNEGPKREIMIKSHQSLSDNLEHFLVAWPASCLRDVTRSLGRILSPQRSEVRRGVVGRTRS